MADIEIPQMRSAWREFDGGIAVDIPAPRPLGFLLFTAVWLLFWFWATLSTLLVPAGHEPGVLLMALFALLAGLWVLLSWLWVLVGREQVFIAEGALLLQRQILGLRYNHIYALAYVQDLRAAVGSGKPSGNLGIPEGRISFDYGGKTVRFAGGVDEAEASALLSLLRKHVSAAPPPA